jgi:hypothetical protein
VHGLHVDGGSESFEGFFGLGVEGWFVCGEGDASFSSFQLAMIHTTTICHGRRYRKRVLCQLEHLKPLLPVHLQQ